MNTPEKSGSRALTEKEKQTLRLIVRGHDAKSIARSLGLSVHTINERLRDARRKMEVSSSREAARILLEAEGGDVASPTPDLVGDAQIGADATSPRVDQETAPIDGAGQAHRRPVLLGVLLMTLALGLALLAALPQVASPPTPATAAEAPDAEVVNTAQHWLALLDESRWDESYRATGASFRNQNTLQMWTAESEKARAQFGKMISRTFVSQENLPAPPAGYEVTKFRTRFAKKAEALETVSLVREDGRWRVAGVMIE
ncbi:LuxR family transcriptional regulator [Sphingomonas panacis]|uniref:LuxR family transcriptional regulator n=1 Tax=Sphingomonas panacis TaxID=1560345 RepID=A0A1B3Z5V3_9SPHN|nr:DUF4019 domain-containing protein [Sphingomonas panacis]AOH82812.1 LuxR family transcriptional regulator [Sphingomonas panacis]